MYKRQGCAVGDQIEAVVPVEFKEKLFRPFYEVMADAKLGLIDPVSYTHLDVYKRQLYPV